jgi:UPF0755 protein
MSIFPASLNKVRVLFTTVISICIICAVILLGLSIAPSDFTANTKIKVMPNTSASEVADILMTNNVIRSTFVFRAYNKIFFSKDHIQQGTYIFDKPASILGVLKRLTSGDKHLTQVKITIPEGSTAKDIADIFKKNLTQFSVTDFMNLTKNKEGYLFPETYFFDEDTTTQDIVDAMTKMFEAKIVAVQDALTNSKRSLKDVITMSSIVEREAATEKDRKIIAGILWKRLDMGMPLQVDAAFYYVLGKKSTDLTKADLAVDSPYNTYKYKGLPPTPIANPGLAAISDTLNSTSTPYFYYITGKDSKMYYAKTLAEHNANINRHL